MPDETPPRLPLAYTPRRTEVLCTQCPIGQRLPFMYIQGNVLIVESRHRGELHRNAISLAELRALLEAADAA